MSLGYRTYLSSDQITQLSIPVSANQWEYDYDAEAYTQTVVLYPIAQKKGAPDPHLFLRNNLHQ